MLVWNAGFVKVFSPIMMKRKNGGNFTHVSKEHKRIRGFEYFLFRRFRRNYLG